MGERGAICVIISHIDYGAICAHAVMLVTITRNLHIHMPLKLEGYIFAAKNKKNALLIKFQKEKKHLLLINAFKADLQRNVVRDHGLDADQLFILKAKSLFMNYVPC